MAKMTDQRLAQLKDQIALAERMAAAQNDPRGTYTAILELMKLELAQHGGAIAAGSTPLDFA